VARKFNIRRRSDKKVVIVIKSDKKLLWDVFNIENPEWSVKKDSPQDVGVSHLPIQSPAQQEEGH